MSVKIGVLNGSNFNRDVDFQSGLSNLLTEGVRKNFMNELEVTENQVDTGMCFIEVTRDAVTPSETFLIPVVVTTQQVISTAGNGYVIVRIEKDKVNDGGDIDADGENVATVEVVTTLPVSDYYIILATLSSSVITDTRAWSQLNDDAIEDPVYYDEDEGSTDSYVISINGVKEYVDGKDYTFKAATTNVGASTLNVNGLGAKAITKGYNSPTNDGDIIANQIVTVRFNSDSNSMQMVSPPSGTLLLEKVSQAEAEAGTNDDKYMTPLKTKQSLVANVIKVIEYSSNATWTKQAGLKAIDIELWAGGGSGAAVVRDAASAASGGGGGGYNKEKFSASQLPASASVVVGAGGASVSAVNAGNTGGVGVYGINGGASSFGSLISVEGGEMGLFSTASTYRPGGDGGDAIPSYSAGSLLYEGGQGGGDETAAGDGYYGGAGGGAYDAVWDNGGDSVWGGGGGGAARSGATGGTSTLGGNGGNGAYLGSSGTITANAGSVRGGGGGAAQVSETNTGTAISGKGGDGFVRITEYY